ncbi:thiamine pyrophosphate carrier protein 1 [Dermatophagoides pteronyssinus]|uniref:thiamine pyrophosphate carrier protein 1 n=1 Tax=Dermatophagoides pteronyssinus TaxID=6956 RepID=UPI003F66CCA1
MVDTNKIYDNFDETKSSSSLSSSTSTSSSSKLLSSSILSTAKQQQKSNWHYVISGFLSGCATRFICQPLDVLKIRFQLQIEPISRSSSISKYRSLTQTFSCIIKEETVFALWKGHVSAQMLSGIYGMAYFSSFEILTRLTLKWLIDHEEIISHKYVMQSQPLVHFICGSMAGFTGTLLSHPFDVIRTRMVSQSEPKTYHTTGQAFMTIAKHEGRVGLYRGFLPTLMQIMPFSGAQFATYNIFKERWQQYYHADHLAINIGYKHGHEIHIQSSFFCGALSGMVAKFLVYPLDLVKKRLQIRGFETGRGNKFGKTVHYEGFIHCITHTIQTENLAAFYKGMIPSIFKSTLSTALHFWLYESLVKKLNNSD